MTTTELRSCVLHLKQDGLTYAAIGRQFGFSRQYAQQVIRGEQNQRGLCPACKQLKDLERHHISYVPEVTELVCTSCHLRKHKGRSKIQQRAIAANVKGCITIKAYARLLHCSIGSARQMARAFGVRIVRQGSLPYPYFDWQLPNKALAEIWLSGNKFAATHLSGIRGKLGLLKVPYTSAWIRHTSRKGYPKALLNRIELEKQKCTRWFATETLDP